MPIYEYQCAQCDRIVEVRQRMSEDKLTTCAEAVARAEVPVDACGKADAPVSRLISNTSFVLKGSGWYKTDYASGASAEKETKTDTATDGKSETKPEPKPETKSDDAKKAA